MLLFNGDVNGDVITHIIGVVSEILHVLKQREWNSDLESVIESVNRWDGKVGISWQDSNDPSKTILPVYYKGKIQEGKRRNPNPSADSTAVSFPLIKKHVPYCIWHVFLYDHLSVSFRAAKTNSRELGPRKTTRSIFPSTFPVSIYPVNDVAEYTSRKVFKRIYR